MVVMTHTLTAPSPATVWPCLPGCETADDHAASPPDRACAVHVGDTGGGDPSPLVVEARRDVDTGALRVEFAGQSEPTFALTPADALAFAGAVRDAALLLGAR